MRVHVHLGHGLDAERYERRFRQGLEVDASPYGFAEARGLGCALSFSTDHAESPAVRWCRRALKRLLGFDLVHAWRNRALWQRADVLWTMQESEWLALAAWGRLGLRRPPMVGNSVWLFDHWHRLGWPRQWLYRRLASQTEQLTVHSVAALAVADQALAPVRPALLPFGVARAQFDGPAARPAAPAARRRGPLRLFAPGSDVTRDWSTLLRAVGGDPRFELHILSQLPAVHAAARGLANVRVERWRGLRQLQAAYDGCDVVVIPMRVNNYAGVTVCLEASWRGRPVLSARTGGVATYLGDLGAVWYEPGDARALRRGAIDCADRAEELVAQARQRLAQGDYSTQGMVQRYLRFSETIVRR